MRDCRDESSDIHSRDNHGSPRKTEYTTYHIRTDYIADCIEKTMCHVICYLKSSEFENSVVGNVYNELMSKYFKKDYRR